MGRHRVKNLAIQLFWRSALPAVMFDALLVLAPGTLGQHLAGNRSAGFSGGHAGGFPGGGFHGGFSAPPTFRGFSGPAPRAFGIAPRMNWTIPHHSFVPQQRGAYAGSRPSYGAENRRRWDHRGRYRRSHPGYGYSGYPYAYANSWELLPWDLGYPDFTGYGDDNETVESNNPQVQPSGAEQEQPPPENEGYRPEYAPAPYRPPASQAAASTPPHNEPQLTLIFKDGHTEIIRNYVLTPSEVIVMDDVASGRIPRISLSDLNLPATERTAHQAGLDFSPPSA
jgi:hypothetical protein